MRVNDDDVEKAMIVISYHTGWQREALLNLPFTEMCSIYRNVVDLFGLNKKNKQNSVTPRR